VGAHCKRKLHGIKERTFEIMLAEVKQNNADISSVILINHSSYNLQTIYDTSDKKLGNHKQTMCQLRWQGESAGYDKQMCTYITSYE